jgi:YVTN family beta-propeller protein
MKMDLFVRRLPSPLAVAAAAACAAVPSAFATEHEGTNTEAAPLPLHTWFDQPRPVERPAVPMAGSRGDCPELVDANAGIDGDHPAEIAFLNDGVTAVIVNRDSNNVAYLDTSTITITGATPVGEYPVHVAVTPDGQYILVPNVFSNTVTVIDSATRNVVATVPITGNQPYRVEVTPNGQYAVVGVINNASDATFSVIDLATFTEIRTFPGGSQGVVGGFANSVFPIGGDVFSQFKIAPDNATIVLPSRGNPNSTIYLFDLNTGAQLAAITTPLGAASVDIHDTTAAVGFVGATSQIHLVDLTTHSVTQVIPTATNLDPVLRFTPDGSRIVTGYLNDTFMIDVATGAEVFRFVTGTVGDIEITADGQYAVVSNFTTRLFDLANPAVVAQMSFAATAELAVSPTSAVAAGLNNRFGEDVHVYTTNGAASAFQGFTLTGPAPEGDAPFDAAISADGSVAVVGMTLSYNVAIVDMASRTVRSHVQTGKRVMDVAITPDGSYAVSCDGDSDTVSIIDLSTDTVVRQLQLPAGSRPAKALISPDGTKAYVLNIAGTDRIWFINLAGASSSIIGSAICGQTGAWNTPQYSENSAIALSPDGSLLAVCDSFNDFVRFFDTTSMTEVAAVFVGDFPIRCAFNPAGDRLFVTNAFSGNVSVIAVAGASSTNLGETPVGPNPLTVDVDASGSYVYVTNYNFSTGSSLYVIDAATRAVVSTIPLGDTLIRDTHLDTASGTLYAAGLRRTATSAPAALFRIAADGPATTIIDTTPLSSNGLDLEFSNGTVIVTMPYLDGIEFFCFGVPCPADWDGNGQVNSTDISAFLTAWLDSLNNQNLNADFDNNGIVNSSDISAFLTAWLQAVQNGC